MPSNDAPRYVCIIVPFLNSFTYSEDEGKTCFVPSLMHPKGFVMALLLLQVTIEYINRPPHTILRPDMLAHGFDPFS